MAIKKLLVLANIDNEAKDLMKGLGFTSFRSVPTGDKQSVMIVGEDTFESNVLLARKIIRIDDELTRRGYRSLKLKDEGYIYTHKTFGSRLWMRIEDNETLSLTIFAQERTAESD